MKVCRLLSCVCTYKKFISGVHVCVLQKSKKEMKKKKKQSKTIQQRMEEEDK